MSGSHCCLGCSTSSKDQQDLHGIQERLLSLGPRYCCIGLPAVCQRTLILQSGLIKNWHVSKPFRPRTHSPGILCYLTWQSLECFAVQAVMAIGDGGNDLPLLKSAGLGVAMGNAVPEVSLYCTYLNDEHQV